MSGTMVDWNHAMKQKKRRSVRHQANLALLHHVSQQFPGPAASSAHIYPLGSAYLFCFLKKKTDASTTWIGATGEEDPTMDAFRFGFDQNWPQAFKPWGSAR